MTIFTAESKLSSDEVLDRLKRGLDGEPENSWWKSNALSSSTVRVYGRIEGASFEASRTAGMSIFGVLASGSVKPAPGGSVVVVELRFGVAPATFPMRLFHSTVLAALVGVAATGASPASLVAWSCFSTAAAGYWWHARGEVKLILARIADAAGGLTWRAPAEGASSGSLRR